MKKLSQFVIRLPRFVITVVIKNEFYKFEMVFSIVLLNQNIILGMDLRLRLADANILKKLITLRSVKDLAVFIWKIFLLEIIFWINADSLIFIKLYLINVTRHLWRLMRLRVKYPPKIECPATFSSCKLWKWRYKYFKLSFDLKSVTWLTH